MVETTDTDTAVREILESLPTLRLEDLHGKLGAPLPPETTPAALVESLFAMASAGGAPPPASFTSSPLRSSDSSAGNGDSPEPEIRTIG